MKKWDKIIIISLLLLAFIPYMLLGIVSSRSYGSTYVVVTSNGEVVHDVVLTGHKGPQEYKVETVYGMNQIRIENEKVIMVEADCPDKVCMKPGAIDVPGESLVCLPNRVYVEIKGDSVTPNDIDIKAH